MKKRFSIVSSLIGAIGLILFTNCSPFQPLIVGSGETVAAKKTISGFTGISVSNGCIAEITKGETVSVTILTDNNIQSYVETWKEGSTLNIRLEPTNSYHPTVFKAIITCPDIMSLSGSGGSQITFTDTSKVSSRAISLSGGSFYTGKLCASTIRTALSGGSRITIGGCCTRLDINGSGGSQCNAKTIIVDSCTADLSGGSKAVATVNKYLNGNLSGGSEFSYFGNPICKVGTSGGSKVIKM